MDTKNIIYYTRYVDDILLMYDNKRINPDIIHEYINQIHSNLQLNPTHENNGSINFLDLLIIRNPNNLKIDIYRKPTTMTQTSISYPTIPLNIKSQHIATRMQSYH
jgi:hypothetical protein